MKFSMTSFLFRFLQHYSFIDFAKYGYDWHPDWFSMVRDPVEKVISWFYFMRAPFRLREAAKNSDNFEMPEFEYLEKDYNECVLSGDPECQYITNTDVEDEPGDHRSQIVHFCGHEPICRLFNNPGALQLAKANVEKYYKVVGITEKTNETLAVLEDQMPEYFKGAQKLYHSHQEVVKFRYPNAHKKPVTEEVKQLVRANFTVEVEFYEYLKQRLQNQFESLTLNHKNQP